MRGQMIWDRHGAFAQRGMLVICLAILVTVLVVSAPAPALAEEPIPSLEEVERLEGPEEAAFGEMPERSIRYGSDALLVEEVRASANAFFPLIQAFRLESESRMSARQSKAGAFDPRLSLEGDVRPLGFYENWSGAGALEQPTQLWGSRFSLRYRGSDGDFPSYDGGRLTDSSGEVAVGVEVPLLRGGLIDKNRAALRGAEIKRASFTPELELELIKVIRAATLSYWDWVATGRVVEVVEDLLEVAEERQSQIARRVEQGSEARINLRDNLRLVVERRARLRGAQRDFRQATFKLSLFLRDAMGERRIVDASNLPREFPDEMLLNPINIEADLTRARSEHPRLQKLALERERLLLDLKLAKNDVLPKLNMGLEGSRDFGGSRAGIDETGKLSSDSRSATEVKMKMKFELPVRLREARGRLGVARIRLEQLDRRIHFAEGEIETEALIALEALEAAYDQTIFARENLSLANFLRDAEARKLGAGLSNLIDLNIRENQAASAAQNLVKAQQDYFRSLAEYRARVATDA
ncbi:MAG: TolC family protein [Myxococcota bacterium]